MTYSKEFSYKGRTFKIKVDLYAKVERKINGKRFHKVTVNDMGHSNYYKEYEIDAQNTAAQLLAVTLGIQEHVDSLTKEDSEETLLVSLGFTPN